MVINESVGSGTACWLRIAGLVLALMLAPIAQADTWRGTAPFCEGQCLPGEKVIKKSNCGNGACCWTGQKVLCQNQNPTCVATMTKTSCKVFVLMCDNGTLKPGNGAAEWVSCSKHACGVCFGWN